MIKKIRVEDERAKNKTQHTDFSRQMVDDFVSVSFDFRLVFLRFFFMY